MRAILLLLSVYLGSLAAFLTDCAAENGGHRLTVDYLLPTRLQNNVYTSAGSDGYGEDFASMWQELGNGQWKNTIFRNYGSLDYSLYEFSNDEIVRTESGFLVAGSEYVSDKVIRGRDVVLKSLDAGSAWSNGYQVEDNWGNITEYKSNLVFEGMENLSYHGKKVSAARISFESSSQVISEAEYSAWGPAAHVSRGTNWYVRGLGLAISDYVLESNGTRHRHRVALRGIARATEEPIEAGGVPEHAFTGQPSRIALIRYMQINRITCLSDQLFLLFFPWQERLVHYAGPNFWQ